MRKSILSILVCLLTLCSEMAHAQRIQQPLGRGVVAVKNGSNVFISWRRLVQEPEDATYNVYVRQKGTDSYSKLNTRPLSVTNLSTTTGDVPIGYEIAVSAIIAGKEQSVSAPYMFVGHSLRSVFMDITYSTFLPHTEYTTKFIWPADLDGDGEYDYVVDRLSITGSSHKIEAYTRKGEYLWTVDMGPNVNICSGHNDMVIAYDMDCDGKSEVVIKSSDGTRFWDKENETWGKYLLNAPNGDTDKDNIIDYNTQSSKNPPQYITVIDGMTGAELTSIEMPYPSDGTDTWSRTNKSDYMGDDYNSLNGHMGICYLDGVHPSVAMEYMVRDKNGTHHYYISAWGYEFVGGKAKDWKEHFTWSRNDKKPWPAEFHHIRIGDVDGDGRDDILDGGFAMNGNGKMIFSAGISHGDRFRVGDINPERPGLETFAIQQNADDMLGQILYDAATGEAIKKWYLPTVGDVGRGECMDVDPAHKGYEMWSTMGGLYDCYGELIPEGPSPFPREGIWWDGEPDREMLDAPDGNGFNAYVRKVLSGTRLIEMAKISDWKVAAAYGTRPAFFGDMIGDWRDEVILHKKDGDGSSGLMGFTTDYPTDISLYCLQENPAYRMQCTTRGYYQSPFPDYYLGFDMPRPQLPLTMVTDLVWKSTDLFTNFERTANVAYAGGKSILLDLYSDEKITISTTMSPDKLYAMPVKRQTITLEGEGELSGDMELWKSGQGRLIVNVPLNNTGKTVVSEGTLEVNGQSIAVLDLRARGTLAGNVTVDSVVLEGALHYEGGRLSPGASADAQNNTNNVPDFAIGEITFKKGLTIDKRTFLEMDIADEANCDLLKIEGNFVVSAPVTFTVRHGDGELPPGRYKLVEYSGTFDGDAENLVVNGLKGLSCCIESDAHALYLVVDSQRQATTGVRWSGAENGLWDYRTKNFTLNGIATEFVAQDGVEFSDEAFQTVVAVDELMPVASANFTNNEKVYSFSGTGGFSGTGSLTMEGTGMLNLNLNKSDYTGATVIHRGTVTVKELADGGMPSSIGAASVSAENWQMGKATLIVNNSNTGTNRGMMLTDTVTMQIGSGTTALKGVVKGVGTLVKSGGGQLNLNGVNSYSGGTILKKGTLALGAWNATFGALGSNLTVEDGTVIVFNNDQTSYVPNFNYKVYVPEDGKMVLNAGKRCHINGSFSGGGSVTLTIPYVRTDMMADWSGFSGTLTVTGKGFRLCEAMNMKETTVVLGSAVNMGHFKSGSGTAQSLTSSVGALSSSATDAKVDNGTYNVGYNNEKVTFAGVLNGTYNKYGTGEWILTGTTNSATITVHEGSLVVNNAEGKAASNVYVNNGGILMGKGVVTNVILRKGATLITGERTYLPGEMTVAGKLVSNGGATLRMRINKNGNGMLNVNEAILGTDTLEIEVVNRSISAGEEFQLLTFDKTMSGSLIIKGTPGEGLVWDSTDLMTKGVVRAVVPEGIHAVGTESVKVYPQLVRSHCTVDASQSCEGRMSFRLFDASGKVVETKQFDASQPYVLSMEEYVAGLYILRLEHNGKYRNYRIVKVE